MPDNEKDPILVVSLDINRSNKGSMEHETLIRDEILPIVSQYLKSPSDGRGDLHQ
jgi:hypothetical protein